jgi:pimeloyl-ACP methyl ester carboxylesterase
MAREQVQVIEHIAASPEAVWAIARDFCGAWHPAIATMSAEHDPRGSLIRAFTVHGEDTLYREQLTWLSDSDRTVRYRHLQGIAGVERYDAEMQVTPAEQGGCIFVWTATAEAPDAARLAAICEGTKFVFETGIAALAKVAEGGAAAAPSEAPAPAAVLDDIIIDTAPKLALTATPPKAGTLCLFLHGIGGARWNWRPQLAAVGGIMRAASLDLRGYGDSALGPAGSTVEDYCNDILRVRDALGADRLVLVGLSYGSWIATSFAMRHPERLAGLVLSGGCTGMSEARCRPHARRFRARRGRGARRPECVGRYPRPALRLDGGNPVRDLSRCALLLHQPARALRFLAARHAGADDDGRI